MPPGGWCRTPTTGAGAVRAASHGPAKAAAMLSRRIACTRRRRALPSTRGPASAGSRGARRHPQVVEVAAGQPPGITEGDEAEHEMRFVHVAPTPFGAAGIFGGGERYPLELARALARHVDCELVTFGAPAVAREPGGLVVRSLRPVARLGHPAHAVAPGLPAALAG